MYQSTPKLSSSNLSSHEKGSQLFQRTSIVQRHPNLYTPPTQEDIENEAFAQNKFEAVSLQLKQTDGTITPVEQERLGVLQAKMNEFRVQRQERASRFTHNFTNIPLHSLDRSAPVQPKTPFSLSRVSDSSIAPNSPKSKEFQSNQLIQRMEMLKKDKEGEKKKDWRSKAIEKVESYEGELKKDNLDKMYVCGDCARLIYAAISQGQKPAGEGTGIESLIAAITEAESAKRKGQVFIFFVDANIVGHFFTILQNGKEATIMQGYLDKISIAQNFAEEGEGRKIRKTDELKNDLSLLVKLRDKQVEMKVMFDGTSNNIIALGEVHTRLFGPGTDEQERKWISKNIFRNEKNNLTWQASFAEGVGEALDLKKEAGCVIF